MDEVDHSLAVELLRHLRDVVYKESHHVRQPHDLVQIRLDPALAEETSLEGADVLVLLEKVVSLYLQYALQLAFEEMVVLLRL